jgi:hypothetical protein
MIITKDLLKEYLDLGVELEKEKDEFRRMEIEIERENIKYYCLIMNKEET